MYLIIGSGPTGISTAYHLHKKRRPFILLDRESQIGGLCKSFILKEMPFDYGVHYYMQKTRYVFDLLKKHGLGIGSFCSKTYFRGEYKFTSGKSGYPREGAFDHLLKSMLKSCHVTPVLGDVVKIDACKKIISTKEGKCFPYRKLISTMPLDCLLQSLSGIGQKFMKVLPALKSKGLGIASFLFKMSFGDSVQYIQNNDSALPFRKLEIRNNISPFLKRFNFTGIQAEVDHTLYKSPSILEKVYEGLVTMNLVNPGTEILAQDYRILENVYPFCHRKDVNPVLNFLESQDIFSIGHLGAWRYLTFDDAIMEGKKVVDRLLS